MATLIRIGNSKGIRIPKAIIDQAQLNDIELGFKITDEGLLIQALKKPRQGWKEQFKKALIEAKSGDTSDAIDTEWLEAPLVENQEWEW